MADNIKGISIELSADVTNVKSAFKDLTKESKSVESQLKDVNRALKLDPSNITLLEAKQKLLNDAISKTSGQLDAARQAQKEFVAGGGDVNSQAYIQMQIETERLAEHLNYLQDESGNVADALNGTGDAAGEAADAQSDYVDAAEKSSEASGAWEVALGNLIANGLEKLITACADAVKGTFTLADDVNTLANNYGLTQEAAYALYQNQELLDYSVGSVTRMMKEQYKELANGTDAYDELGIAVKDADGNMLSQEQIFANTIEYLRDIQDPVERAAQGTELLGNKYYDLGGILNSTDSTFAEFIGQLTGTDEELQNDLDGLGAFKDMIDRMKQSLTNAAVSLGTIFGKLSQLRGVLPAITVLIAGMGTAWLIFGGAATIIEGVTTAMTALNAVMMANPIGLIVLAVAALVAAFILLWNNCEGFRNFFINMWETIKTVATTAWNTITGLAAAAWTALQSAWDGAATFFTTLWTKIKTVFTDAWNGIKDLFKNAKNIGEDIINGIKEGIEAKINAVTETLTSWWNGVINWFKNNHATSYVDEVTTGGTGDGSGSGETPPPPEGSYRTGTNYVGYDQLAMIHEGEAVLTRSQAEQWRAGESAGFGNTVQLNVYAQELTESQIDYLCTRVNMTLGGMA